MKSFVPTLTLTAKPKRLAGLALAALSALMVATEGVIAANGWQPETLRDISQLQVRVVKVCRLGISAERLKTAIESYLSQRGIPIMSTPSGAVTTPRISIIIDCENRTQSLTTKVSIGVIQNVQLNGRTIEAETYGGLGYFGYVATAAEYSRLEERHLTATLDRFVSDWRSVR
jgi:hypothetical protein